MEGDTISMWGCSSETHQGLEAVVIGRHRRQVHDLRRGRVSESAVEAKCEAVGQRLYDRKAGKWASLMGHV